MRVKTDRNDARGIAQLVRLGWFKAVHVKAPSAQETRAMLNARRFLVDKLTGIENSMRASPELRAQDGSSLALKVGRAGTRAGSRCSRPRTCDRALLRVRDVLRRELRAIDRRL